MRIGLFIPCYVDQLRPEVGLATVRLLEGLGHTPVFPEAQTCCGQPFSTAGERAHAARLGRRHAEIFESFDVVVTPSGSCAAHVRHQLPALDATARARAVAGRTRELCEFLVETDALRGRSASLARRVALHASCHALRELHHGTPSETRSPTATAEDPARRLLGGIEGLSLVALARRDECCGFGGVFAVEEAAVSCRMGLDRLADQAQAGAEVVTSTDVSCLLQLESLARLRTSPLVFRHVAELLADAYFPDASPDTDASAARGPDGPH